MPSKYHETICFIIRQPPNTKKGRGQGRAVVAWGVGHKLAINTAQAPNDNYNMDRSNYPSATPTRGTI